MLIEMKKWCDLSNPKVKLTVEGMIKSCFFNPERKKFSSSVIGLYGAPHPLCDIHVSCEYLLEKFRDTKCAQKMDSKEIEFYSTECIFPQFAEDYWRGEF